MVWKSIPPTHVVELASSLHRPKAKSGEKAGEETSCQRREQVICLTVVLWYAEVTGCHAAVL